MLMILILRPGDKELLSMLVQIRLYFLIRALSFLVLDWEKGWGEIKIKPGAFAKVAMRFDLWPLQ
jgi:hypothetical protein